MPLADAEHMCESGCGVLMEWNEDEHCWECPKCGEQVSYPEDELEEDSLSAYDAALIWESNGRDEDYSFGYSEDELRDAL